MKDRTLAFALVVCVTLALPALVLAQSGEPPKQEQAKKKPRRVWTNDDFDSGNRPAEEKKEAAAAGQELSAEELFAELDAARADLAQQEKELVLDRKQYDGQLERLRNADNDYDRDAYRRSLDVAEEHLAQREQTVEDLKKRIAELEQLTSGLKRPAAKAKPQGPPGTAVTPDAAEVVNPGGGPIPQKEPPPQPPQ